MHNKRETSQFGVSLFVCAVCAILSRRGRGDAGSLAGCFGEAYVEYGSIGICHIQCAAKLVGH